MNSVSDAVAVFDPTMSAPLQRAGKFASEETVTILHELYFAVDRRGLSFAQRTEHLEQFLGLISVDVLPTRRIYGGLSAVTFNGIRTYSSLRRQLPIGQGSFLCERALTIDCCENFFSHCVRRTQRMTAREVAVHQPHILRVMSLALVPNLPFAVKPNKRKYPHHPLISEQAAWTSEVFLNKVCYVLHRLFPC